MLKSRVTRLLPATVVPPFISDVINRGNVVMLVVPIDFDAPKGRFIMPQVQTIREALEVNTVVIVIKDKEVRAALNNLKTLPDMVVTDDQIIINVAANLPDSVRLTTFSMLMSRYKGDLSTFVKAIKVVDELQDGDKVLIAEACSHHAQEDDIGKVKIPRWMRLHTKKNLQFEIRSGEDFPENLADYKLIVHCGGCMLTRHSMQMRIKEAKFMEVPIVNYGVLISYMHGAIPRALEPFPEAVLEWKKSCHKV